MARPPKYTDSDIAAAIQTLIAEGETINPMRVRIRLGGGNVERIKAVIGSSAGPLAVSAEPGARLPEALAREFQRLSSETSQHILSVANKCWATARTASASDLHDENVRLRKRMEALEGDLSASTDLIAQIEGQRDERDHTLLAHAKEKMEFLRVQANLQSALRNAESDLRAAQRVIDTFERNQLQDRDDIRALQKRVESLVAEIAVLKAKSLHTTKPKSSLARKKPA